MPKPKKNEKKNPFISRCVRQLVHEEGKDPKAAVGECYGIWDEHKKKDFNETVASYKFLQLIKGIPQPIDTNMVHCDHCLTYFDYTKCNEAGMGYVKCPGCGRNIDQTGRSVKKELNTTEPNEGGE